MSDKPVLEPSPNQEKGNPAMVGEEVASRKSGWAKPFIGPGRVFVSNADFVFSRKVVDGRLRIVIAP